MKLKIIKLIHLKRKKNFLKDYNYYFFYSKVDELKFLKSLNCFTQFRNYVSIDEMLFILGNFSIEGNISSLNFLWK